VVAPCACRLFGPVSGGWVALLQRVVMTVANTAGKIVSFFVLFGVVAYAFAIFGHLLLASDVDEFTTISASVMMMLRSLMGDPAVFSLVVEFAGDVGFLYLLAWLIISRTLLINIVIAVFHVRPRALRRAAARSPRPSGSAATRLRHLPRCASTAAAAAL